jgi:peroxiredoxin Q/BCP
MFNKIKLFPLSLLFAWNSHAQTDMQKIQVGSKIPEFSLLDQNGKEFNSKDVVGKEKLVIYFYPKDETPGCTKEACAFRDNYEVFRNAGATIIGISGQSVESHKEFAENHHLPFTLLSDTDNKVRKLFGVKTAPIPGRVSFVVDKTGTVVYTFDSLTQATRHVDEAMRILKEMK